MRHIAVTNISLAEEGESKEEVQQLRSKVASKIK